MVSNPLVGKEMGGDGGLLMRLFIQFEKYAMLERVRAGWRLLVRDAREILKEVLGDWLICAKTNIPIRP